MKKIIFILGIFSLLVSCTTPSNSNHIEDDEIIDVAETEDDNPTSTEDDDSTSENDDNSTDESNNENDEEVETSETEDDNPTSTEDENKTLLSEFIIIFDCGDDNKFSQKIKEGDLVTKPNNPTKEDYNFAYWYIEDENEEFDFNTIITSDITLKAKWYKTWCEIDDTDDFTTFEYYENNVKCTLKGIGLDIIRIVATIDNEGSYFDVKKINNRIYVELNIGHRKVIDVNRFENKVYFTTIHE